VTSPLFHVGLGSLDQAVAGDRFTLDGAEGHHAATVMRLEAGEQVLLSDTGSRRAHAMVIGKVAGVVPGHEETAGAAPGATDGRGPDRGVTRGAARGATSGRGGSKAPAALELELVDVVEDAPELPRLVLLQALAKDKRDLQAVESATELGVDAVIPWQAERSVVKWKPSTLQRKHEEWTSLVTAASKQSRRTSVPEVRPLQSTAQYAESLRSRDDVAVLVLDESGTQPLSAAVAELGLCEARLSGAAHAAGSDKTGSDKTGSDQESQALTGIAEVHLVVGPEGGISAAERAALGGARSVVARLGPTVLRASSAGAAALTAVNVLLGRWDRPFRDENQRVE
jgi:16S rRNA (uracil1498-N3)-methyltransferase